MALVPYTVTALAESDADGTGGKNIVAGAVVIFYKNAVAQTLYDNASGLNPSSSKSTGAQGQVTVFVEQGVYDIEINGGTSRGVSVSADDSLLGTAALADLTTSPTDTTTGSVLKVGDFGLGTTISETDFDNCLESGFYYLDNPATNPPISGSINWTCFVTKGNNSNNLTQFGIDKAFNRIYFRHRNGAVFSGWDEFYHSGNSVNPLDFGLGETGTPPVLSDIESTSIATGFYGTNAGSFTGTNPTNRTLNSVVQFRDTSRQYQMLFNVDQKFLFRVDQGVWNEVYHSGNSVNPLDYGLGETGAPPSIPTDNTAIPSGLYRETSGAVFPAFSCVLDMNYSDKRSAQIAASTQAGQPNRFFGRTQNIDNSWELPVEFYHSGNTNFTEFGYGGTDELVTPICFAKGIDVLRVYLPIASTGFPTGTDVEGTFAVLDVGTAFIATGVTTASFTAIQYGKRWVTFEITGLSGLTADDQYSLLSETSASGITVNF